MYKRILKTLRDATPNLRVAGFSATCFRLDSGHLDEGEDRIFDKTVCSYGIAHGVREYLSLRVIAVSDQHSQAVRMPL
jgi:DNA repair protein RadD